MKKTISIVLSFLFFNSFIFMSGCTEELPEETPTALVILAGNHSNSKKINFSLQDKVNEVYSTFGNATLIVIDGNPTVERKDGQPIGFYNYEYTQQSKDDYKYKNIWEREYLEPQKSSFCDAIENAKPDDPEVDTLKAIQESVKSLNEMKSSMKTEVNKEIIIYDTGFSTSGALNFLNEKLIDIINSQTRIWEDENKKNEVKAIIDDLCNKMELPDLSDIKITWYGLGEVCPPQPELSNLNIENLRYIWGEILKKSKAIPSNESDVDNDYGIFVEMTTAEDLSYAMDVTPIIFWNDIVKLTEKELAFKPDSDEYCSETEAKKVLEPYAKNLMKYPDMNILLVGTTADPSRNGGSKSLSERRAKRVKKTLLEFGITNDRINTIGLGAKSPWYESEWKNGEFNETIAKENRAVIILSSDSDQAKEILRNEKK